MSVTFTPELGPIDHYVVECLNCRVTHTERFATHEQALTFQRAVASATATVTGCAAEKGWCEDAATTTAAEAIGTMPSVNISNVNAVTVLDTLGVNIDGEELCGGLPAEDFLGRVLTALAIAPESPEIPSYAVSPNVIACGRPAGYLQDRLRGLHEVAEFALAHDRDVTWA